MGIGAYFFESISSLVYSKCKILEFLRIISLYFAFVVFHDHRILVVLMWEGVLFHLAVFLWLFRSVLKASVAFCTGTTCFCTIWLGLVEKIVRKFFRGGTVQKKCVARAKDNWRFGARVEILIKKRVIFVKCKRFGKWSFACAWKAHFGFCSTIWGKSNSLKMSLCIYRCFTAGLCNCRRNSNNF